MKKHLFVLCSLLLAAGSSTSALANTEAPATIRLTIRPYIELGMSREMVREMIGEPSAQLSKDVWVFFDFKGSNAVPSGRQNPASVGQKDALVVAFKGDRVTVVRACDSQPVRALIAQQEKSKQPATVVAAK